MDYQEAIEWINERKLSRCENCIRKGSEYCGGNCRIENEVFIGSTLSTIYIPNSVNYIGTDAFCGCHNLTDVHIEINDPNSVTFGDDDDCFYDINGNDNRQRRLHVPKGTKDLYKEHPAFEIFDIIIEE